jgi:hypothetical protein
MADPFLTDTDWRDLLRAIHARKVIPVASNGNGLNGSCNR